MGGPLKRILDRDLSREIVREAARVVCSALCEAVDYRTNLFGRARPSGVEEREEDLSILGLYLNVLEMIDAAQILLQEGAGESAVLQLRSCFEALLSIEFILREDTPRRARTYYVGLLLSELRDLTGLDPDTESGKVLLDAISKDAMASRRPLPDPKKTREDAARIQDAAVCAASTTHRRTMAQTKSAEETQARVVLRLRGARAASASLPSTFTEGRSTKSSIRAGPGSRTQATPRACVEHREAQPSCDGYAHPVVSEQRRSSLSSFGTRPPKRPSNTIEKVNSKDSSGGT